MKAILRRTTTMLCAAVMAVPMALSVYASIPDPTTSGVKFNDSVVISNESGSSISGGDTDQPVTSSDYTITIPATFDIKNSGWNEIGEIKASGTLEEGKKLVVTATSANDWALKSGENEVSYEMMNYEDDSAPATSWEFTDLPASQSIGINVEDYSGKPAGSYTDTVTFTASVESAKREITVGTVFPIGTVDFGDYCYRKCDMYDYITELLKNIGTATVSISDNYSHPTLGNFRVIVIKSSTIQFKDQLRNQWEYDERSINYFKVDNYDTTPTGIRIASGSGTEDDPFTFELVFD